MTAEAVTAAVRELHAQGLSVRDIADTMRMHPGAVRDMLPCLCREDETTRYEHPNCPRHVRRQ